MHKGHLAALTFTVMFGFSYMASKIALAHVSPIGLVAYRYLFAFITIELFRRTGLFHLNVRRPKGWTIGLVVLFQPFLYSVFSTFGLNLITSSEAVMMVALVPVLSGLLSAFFLRERPSLRQWLFTFISISGILYIQVSLQTVDSTSQPLGFLFMFLAVMSGAIYNVTSRQASKTVQPSELTYYMMLFGAISLNALYLGELIQAQTLPSYVTNLTSLSLLVPVLFLGIFATVVAFFMLNYALSVLPAHRVSIYANLVTVIGIFAGYVLLNESLYSFHIIGSMLIVIGVYGTVIKPKVQSPIPH